ncbi:MAG: hypothetical protein IH987_07470 [Planctomycetes bacterium]|nr:hypothetical protein [Planctomycetota bacterium]
MWFEYVATCTGSVTVDTVGSGQEDTVLSVYDACGASEITCNDDTVGPLSQVMFAAAAGQSYWIRLASIGVPGDYDLNISCSGVPANDNCAMATVVTDGAPAAEGDNSAASAADDAEAICSASDNDVWFQYVATCTGAATVDTAGSGQADTVLSVYDGCGGNEIACNDNAGGASSQVLFDVTSGQSYWIRLASIGVPGDYALNISCSETPVNDNCTAATVVSNGVPAAEGDNSAAGGIDDAEAGCRASDNDVWFEYVATCTGAAIVDTFDSGQVDTVLSAYDACGGNEMVCNDDTDGTLSKILFAVTSGQSYWIRLASIAVPGDYDLNISCSGAPANGICATATVVTDGAPAAEGDNAGEGGIDDAEAGCGASDQDVWFAYQAVCTGVVTVDTFGSGQQDTVLSVYDACGGSEIVCNDDTVGLLSRVTFGATAGQSFRIRLASVATAGDYNLNIRCAGVPSPPTAAGFPHDILKNRYISIDPRGADLANVGRNLDIRLTLSSTLVNGVTAVGLQWWAHGPDADCISVVAPNRPLAPPDWSACPTLHLTGCPIIPTSTYAIVVIDGSFQSDPFIGAATQAKPGLKWHGDVVGFLDGLAWTPPQGSVNIDDAVAAIKTYQNPGALNATHVSVTDVHPNLIGTQINKTVNFDDVFVIVLGFKGFEYPGTDLDLCPNP